MSASGSKKAIFAALAGNALVAITKFVAAGITGSSAMFSEGIHSVVDTGNQGLLLYGIKRAQKPADDEFPFGHGKEIYFWSFVVSILIFAVGAGVSIYEGIHHIIHPEPMKSVMVNYIVLGLAFLFEGAVFLVALKEFKKVKGDLGYFEAVKRGKDPSLFVVLFEDFAATMGLLVAALGIFLSQSTGILQFDGVASVVIGLILGTTAFWLAVETKGLLIGERAGKGVVEGIRVIVTEHAEIDHVNELLTMHMGPDFILLNISATFKDAAKADDIEEAIEELSVKIKEDYPEVKRIFVEAGARHRQIV